jgi:phage/plasmid-like protein (TIGR03299 family)
MPAELDRNAQTGQAAVFAVGQMPWHREGTNLTEAPNLDEAIRLAGVGFEVALRSLFMPSADTTMGVGGDLGADRPLFALYGEARMFQCPTGRAVVRTDRPGPDGVLSVVGDGYEPLQNRDCFSVLEPLLDRGVATLETGGSLRGGRDVWMMCRWNIEDPVVQEVFSGLGTVPFGLITNNHASKRRAIIMDTPVRVVCANTLKASLDGRTEENSVAVVHRGGARVRLIEAAESLWGGVIERYVAIAGQYREMKATILSVEQFTKSVLDVLAPVPGKPANLADLTGPERAGFERAEQNAAIRRATLTQKWYEGKGHVGDQSAWEAFNAAVEVLDHDGDLFKVRGSRVESLITGKLAQRKREVLEAVLAIAR